MAQVTKGKTFVSGETVTPTKLNELVDNATVTGIVNADIDNAAGIVSSKLATAAQQALVPAGAVMAFAMNSAPAGWLAADGSNVSRSTYAALFSAISTTYGAGDGSTTFALPDLRGYFVRGTGTNGDGTAAGTFGAKQAAAMLNHTHTGTTSSNGAHTHGIPVTSPISPGGANTVLFDGRGVAGGLPTDSAGAHTHTMTTGNPSTGGGTETRPVNIAMLYCVKF
jgi:microcystin-dependent protein